MKKLLIFFSIFFLSVSLYACSIIVEDAPENIDTPDIENVDDMQKDEEGTLLEQILPKEIAASVIDIDEDAIYECNLMTGGITLWRRFVEGEAAGSRKCMVLYNTNPADKSNAEVIIYDKDHYSVIHSQTDFDSNIEYRHCYYVFDTESENPVEVYMILANEEHLKYSDILGLDNGHHDSGIWVRKVAANIGQYYWIDGTYNLCNDEKSCKEAVEALKLIVEEHNRALIDEGKMETFKWKSIEADIMDTAMYISDYSGSDYAKRNKITSKMLVNDFLSLRVEFFVQYANNMPEQSGNGKTYIYMFRDENGKWYVRDFLTPIVG